MACVLENSLNLTDATADCFVSVVAPPRRPPTLAHVAAAVFVLAYVFRRRSGLRVHACGGSVLVLSALLLALFPYFDILFVLFGFWP